MSAHCSKALTLRKAAYRVYVVGKDGKQRVRQVTERSRQVPLSRVKALCG